MCKKSVFVLLLSFILYTAAVYAICTPPATGNFSVNTVISCDGQSIVITGNIFINGTGVLILNNSNMTLNSSSDREFNIFVNDTGVFRGNNARLFRNQSTFDVIGNQFATINFSDSVFTNGSRFFFNDNVTSYFKSVTFSDDLFARGNSTNFWHDINVGKFEETGTATVTEFSGSSVSLVNNSLIQGLVDFGLTASSPRVEVFASNFTNNSDFRGDVYVNFKSQSSIAFVAVYLNTPSVNGSINFSSSAPTSFAPTDYLRFYPTFVRDKFDRPVPDAEVIVKNLSGTIFFNGTTDSEGFVEVNLSFSLAQCGATASRCDDDFNITVNSFEVLGLQTDSPIYLQGEFQAVPEFSTFTLLLALVLVVSGFVVMRRKFY